MSQEQRDKVDSDFRVATFQAQIAAVKNRSGQVPATISKIGRRLPPRPPGWGNDDTVEMQHLAAASALGLK